MNKFIRRNLPGYTFLFPWLIGFFALALGPILASLYLSFTRYDILTPPQWAGLENYEYMFTWDDRFWQSMKVTFTFVFLSVPAKLIFALGIAMALDKGIRGIGLYRAVYYLPSILGASIAVAILWRQVFEANGVINSILAIFGIAGPHWMGNPDYSLYTIVTLAVWQFGAPMLIFLAGLRAIPNDLYEAAEIDAASKTRKFFAITLPLLGPVIFFNLVLQTIDAFKIFTNAFVISGGNGAPADSLLFFTIYLYEEAFKYFRMGYASALAWVLLIVIALFTAIAFFSSRYWVYYENERD
ncbi:carbohydrate ABC transporter permease [Pelagibacterium xiamenense]|uniref:carbohydrate ABC transporter permease n=1 Tax=Pelagibacterium xiamenense TaxID=2901140 RepID=UPI001E5A28BA|nr:sugar ABC transporter permease [Pelagibacterium xiamenense]MCD7059898.1 sugar ABC transporter permease [Pelagibacterium xiamenense]